MPQHEQWNSLPTKEVTSFDIFETLEKNSILDVPENILISKNKSNLNGKTLQSKCSVFMVRKY